MYMLLEYCCLGGRFPNNGPGLPEARTDNPTCFNLNPSRWGERLATSRAPRGALEGGVRRVGPEAVGKA